MARKQNTIPTVQITLSTTERLKFYLEALVETGLYGKTVAEAADRLLTEAMKLHLEKGTFDRADRARDNA